MTPPRNRPSPITRTAASALGRPGEDGRLPLIIVTGMSGAGLSTAMACLDDLGYEAVDNLRLSLLPTLVEQMHDRPLAIGLVSRTRDFSADRVLDLIGQLRQRPELDVHLLFLDAQDDALQRRYMETRRPHPHAVDRRVADGIALERTLLAPLAEAADVTVDTSDLSVHDLTRILVGHFHLDDGPELHIFVTSFAYRHGVPREADLVFDVRFLDNPHWDPALRPLSGLDEAVQQYVAQDPDFEPFFVNLTRLIEPLLPRYQAEGKHYLTIALGCTGGRHRSVVSARRLAAWLAERGFNVKEAHRDVDRRVSGAPLGATANTSTAPVAIKEKAR